MQTESVDVGAQGVPRRARALHDAPEGQRPTAGAPPEGDAVS